jgi:ABC-2 type transport system ATP-binding protein
MELMINAQDVSKSYGREFALKGLSLQVERGSAFGLIGPNGAGKTTFVRLLLGLSPLETGVLELQGKSVQDEQARNNVGYLPEKFQFFHYYTVQAVASFYGAMRGVSKVQLKEQVHQALSAVGISDLGHRKLNTLSKGQMQRLGIANLLVGDNKLLILDEPFSGLDPIAIKELKDLLRKLKDQGITIFINSHILSEIEQLCDSVAILNKGECLANGKIKELIGDQSLEDFFYSKIQKGQ